MKALAMGLSAAVLFSMLPSAHAWTGQPAGSWQLDRSRSNSIRQVYVQGNCTKTVTTLHKMPSTTRIVCR